MIQEILLWKHNEFLSSVFSCGGSRFNTLKEAKVHTNPIKYLIYFPSRFG